MTVCCMFYLVSRPVLLVKFLLHALQLINGGVALLGRVHHVQLDSAGCLHKSTHKPQCSNTQYEFNGVLSEEQFRCNMYEERIYKF